MQRNVQHNTNMNSGVVLPNLLTAATQFNPIEAIQQGNVLRQQRMQLGQQQNAINQQKQAQAVLGESLMQGASPLETAQRLYQINPEMGKQYLGFQQAQIENQQKQAVAQQEQIKTAMQQIGDFTAQLSSIDPTNKPVKDYAFQKGRDSLIQAGALSEPAQKILAGEWSPTKEQFLQQAFNQQGINSGRFKPSSDIGQINRDVQLGYISPQQAQREFSARNAVQNARMNTNTQNTSSQGTPIKLTPQDNKRLNDISEQASNALEGLDNVDNAISLLDQGIGGMGGVGVGSFRVGKGIGSIESIMSSDMRTRRQQYENAVERIAADKAKIFGGSPSEYETKLIQKMQATTSNDEKTNRAILNEVKQAMQRRIDKQEYIVNAIDNGIKPLQAETMFNKEERQKQIDRNKQNKNNQAQPQQNKQPMQGQNSYTTKGGYSYTVVE
jgi:hypothetical protein